MVARSSSSAFVRFKSFLGSFPVRGVSQSDVTTVPKRKSHRGLDMDLSLSAELDIRKGWKENGETRSKTKNTRKRTDKKQHTGAHAWMG